MHTKPILTLADAARMMAACKAEAAKNQWNVAICVVDDGGYVIALERLDGAPLQAPQIAQGKAFTAAISRTATKALEDVVKDRPAVGFMPGRLAIQGGVPLFHEGVCVGAIGVSGVKSAEDEVIALAGAKALTAA